MPKRVNRWERERSMGTWLRGTPLRQNPYFTRLYSLRQGIGGNGGRSAPCGDAEPAVYHPVRAWNMPRLLHDSGSLYGYKRRYRLPLRRHVRCINSEGRILLRARCQHGKACRSSSYESSLPAFLESMLSCARFTAGGYGYGYMLYGAGDGPWTVDDELWRWR